MAPASLWGFLSQCYPPKPKYTEKDIPSLSGKVYIITGSNTGIGKELAQMLYAKHAKVYIASRSREKAVKSIEDIKKRAPKSTGELLFLPLDLADLRTIKPFAEEFLRQENKLHVLFNNAGVMKPAPGSKTAQDYELQLGVNNIGPFLLTKLLTPALITTAKTEPANSVRVVWVSSSAADGASPKGGVPLDYLDYHDKKTPFYWYAVSKAGNYLHATEFTKLYRGDGIVSVPLNPGNLNSELYRTALAPVMGAIIRIVALHPPIFGAYTELFAGLSPVVTVEKSGDWVVPWGRFMKIRKDLIDASKSKSEGGSGIAEKFWKWTEEQIQPYQ